MISKINHGCCGGEGTVVMEKGKRKRGAHKGTYKENVSPKLLAWKLRRAEFHEFCKPVGLKSWHFKDYQAWLGYSLEGTVLFLESKKANNLGTDSI